MARFDADRLIDYRSRRPLMIYDNSHWESYEAPELALHLLRDHGERPFLLLTGPEPDHEWKLFTEAILGLSARLGSGLAVSFLGIPAGMPHTRPLGVIAHATRDDLISAHQRLPSRIQLPGSAPALLELRLGEAGRDALGFAVQVPHYLAQAVYPPAALALLGSVVTATGLELPDAELREASTRTNEAIERQVAESAEVAELVRALEQQYDTAAEANGAQPDSGAGLLGEGESMPTADELAAQFERFLAENQGRIDPPGPRTTEGPRQLADDDQLSRGVVEPLVTVGGADHDVLDPRAVRAGVDARLDRERHAGLEDLAVAGHDVRVLVRLQPDPVPGPVEERLAVPGRGDRLARGRVDGLGASPPAGSRRRRPPGRRAAPCSRR